MSSEFSMSQATSKVSPPTAPGASAQKESRYGTSCFECRRRKVKCLPSSDNPAKCKACLRRGSQCVEQELAPTRSGALHRKKLSERIGRLEHLIRSMRDEGRDARGRALMSRLSEEGIIPSHRSDSDASHLDDLALTPDEKESHSSGRGSVALSNNEQFQRLLFNEISILDLLTPSGNFKHQKVCKLFLKVLESTPNVERSLDIHSQFWAHTMKRSNPNASFGDIDLKEYARRAIAGDNPIKIARIIQIATSGAPDMDHFQKLVSLIDRLIIYDDEYMSSLEGLECAFEQGRYFVEMGQVRSSWLHIRKVISHLEVMGSNRDQASPREEWLRHMAFQTDRFLSLMVHSPIVSGSIYSKILVDNDDPLLSSSKNMDGMTRLAILCGRVLDYTRTAQTVPYSSVLDLDQELNHFGSQLPSERLSIPVPIPSKEQRRTRQKTAEKNLMNLQFLQAKLMLHMPFMLKSTTEAGLEYSRSCCFEAAREIVQLFQAHRTSEVVEKLCSFKTSPTDWIGYIAAVVLLCGQIGSLGDPGQLAEDRKLIDSTIHLYEKIPTKFAHQSGSTLQELSALRDNPTRDLSLPTRVTIPLFGDIVIPCAQFKPNVTNQPVTSAWSVNPETAFAPGFGFDNEFGGGLTNDLMNAPFSMDNNYYVQPLPFAETGLNLASTPVITSQPPQWQESIHQNMLPTYEEQNPYIMNMQGNIFNPP